MKVLLTADPEIPVPPKLYGGIERIVDGLATELRFRGHTVGLVANSESSCRVDYFLPWTSSEAKTRLDHLQNSFQLRKAVTEFHPQIVHSFSRLGYLLPLLLSRLPKVMSYQRHTGGRQIKIATRLAGKSLSFTACSQFVVQMGQPWGGEWQGVHNFVDTDFYSFNPVVSDSAPLVFLSRIERVKGLHTAIAIALRVKKKLVIAGNRVTTEEGNQYWKSEVEPHLDGDDIEYVGPVDDEQKKKLLRAAAALIVPVEWDEPFGIVFAEALSCGTPVISCSRGAVPEIVRHGVEGFLINDIEGGCQAVEKLNAIDRANCRQRVESKFSRKIIVNKYDSIYHQMTNPTRI